jgi:hypothetical protein
MYFVLVMVVLSACVGTGPNAQVTTSTVEPSSTPLPSQTPVLASPILADFPLAVGTIWEYSAEITYQDPNDYMKLLAWTGTVTDRVIDERVGSGGSIVFTVQEDLEPEPPEQVWRRSGTFEYTLSGDGVFKGSMKIYQVPLQSVQSWQAFEGTGYETLVQRVGEVVTPYGGLDDCYTFTLDTNPDTTMDTFCMGIGFVKHSYRHHGTPQNEEFELVSFTLGQP